MYVLNSCTYLYLKFSRLVQQMRFGEEEQGIFIRMTYSERPKMKSQPTFENSSFLTFRSFHRRVKLPKQPTTIHGETSWFLTLVHRSHSSIHLLPSPSSLYHGPPYSFILLLPSTMIPLLPSTSSINSLTILLIFWTLISSQLRHLN